MTHTQPAPDAPISASGPGRTRVDSLAPGRTALVVVDMQNFFVELGWPATIPGAAALSPRINALAAALRARGGHVVFLRHAFTHAPPHALRPWHTRTALRDEEGRFVLRAGSHAHKLHVSLEIETSDMIVDKYRFSALHPLSSPLERALNAVGVEDVIIVGVATNVCCESTARDAQMCGYRVIVCSDATAALTQAEHDAALLNLRSVFADVRTTADVVAMITQT